MKFEDVESARETYYKKLKESYYVAGPIAIIISVLGFLASPFFGLFTLFIGIGALTIYVYFKTNKYKIAYHKAYKGYFVEQNLKKTFADLSYDHQKGLDHSLLRTTGMINTGDVYSSNDLTIGKYKNVGFAQADAHIQTESTDSDGNTTYYTIFQGRFMIFEFPKKFNFKLELVGKKFHAYHVPGKDKNTGRKMVKIRTESSEFNQIFKIFGQDDFESFYLLDPAIIVKIQAIAERYKYKVLLGFIDNKMLVAIDDGKDSFEPPRFTKPIDEKAELEKISSDIKVITDFVDIISSH